MNTFARIKPTAKYNKVAYYSVIVDDDEDFIFEKEESLFDEFRTVNGRLYKEKMQHILNWVKVIGNEHGAKEDFFRNEAEIADTSALPPKGKSRKPQYTEDGDVESNNLRLYCFRVNDNVVFLFNGALKTKDKPQYCPNVRPHFKLANQLTKAIENAFREKDIFWNEDCTEINCKEDFLIEF